MQQENKPNLVNKVHISQSMVLHKVIGIRARINNKLSRHEKQGPGYNPAKIVGSKCSHNSTIPGPRVN